MDKLFYEVLPHWHWFFIKSMSVQIFITVIANELNSNRHLIHPTLLIKERWISVFGFDSIFFNFFFLPISIQKRWNFNDSILTK